MDITGIAMNDWKNSSYHSNLAKVSRTEQADAAKLRQACQDFETIFVKMMLDSMRKTVSKTNLMGERSSGEEVFEDMLYEQYAERLSSQADLGIARLLYRQLSPGG